MFLEETKQSFRGDSAYRFSWGANSSKGRVQKRSETKIIKSDDSYILRDPKTVFVQRFQSTNGCIIVARKYRIERDPLSIAKKIIQGFISDVAFEFTIKNKFLIKRNIICGQRRFISHFAPIRIL